jgi:hypothetical protein
MSEHVFDVCRLGSGGRFGTMARWWCCASTTVTSACHFPQAGPGKKHERPIVLEPWQAAIVEAEPWRFLRGCIRSDGCVFINRTGRYEYLS